MLYLMLLNYNIDTDVIYYSYYCSALIYCSLLLMSSINIISKSK